MLWKCGYVIEENLIMGDRRINNLFKEKIMYAEVEKQKDQYKVRNTRNI